MKNSWAEIKEEEEEEELNSQFILALYVHSYKHFWP